MARKFEKGSAFDKVSMDQIIGAPLRATAKANAMMAKEQIGFMMDFCFKKDGNNFEPVMIEMMMTTSKLEPAEDPDDSPVLRRFKTKFNLPLLTLIPLNSLAVESFEIDFDMEVTSIEQEESSSKSTKGEEGEKELKLMGKVSNKSENQRARNSQYQKKVDSKLSVNVKGGQLPLPVGITSIIDLYKNNMEPLEISEE